MINYVNSQTLVSASLSFTSGSWHLRRYIDTYENASLYLTAMANAPCKPLKQNVSHFTED